MKWIHVFFKSARIFTHKLNALILKFYYIITTHATKNIVNLYKYITDEIKLYKLVLEIDNLYVYLNIHSEYWYIVIVDSSCQTLWIYYVLTPYMVLSAVLGCICSAGMLDRCYNWLYNSVNNPNVADNVPNINNQANNALNNNVALENLNIQNESTNQGIHFLEA
jgi:hypothetical protein